MARDGRQQSGGGCRIQEGGTGRASVYQEVTDRIIRELVAGHGTVYCGVSAGSIVAGPEIGIAAWSPDWDRNEVGLTDLTGLRLVPFLLSPHYVPEDAALIAARLPLPHPILALRDGQAWVVDGDIQHLIDLRSGFRLRGIGKV